MCKHDYCVYHYKSTELVSLYTLDIGLKINTIIIIMYLTQNRGGYTFSQDIPIPFYCLINIHKIHNIQI